MQSLISQANQADPNPGLVLVDPPKSGACNMAVDEALLADAKPFWPIVLRIYEWDRPTLSIGHFQRLEDRDNSESLRALPWVRRKTGGGAIVHDHELTYSILFPNRDNQPTKGHSEALYRAIHLQFVEALTKLGWDAKLSEACTCKVSADAVPAPFLCFLRRSPVDLVVGDDKILGSAQRRSANGLLQHGSFLLQRSMAAQNLAGLLDGEGGNKCGYSPNDWQKFFVATLKDGIAELLQVSWRNGKLSELMGPSAGISVVPQT